MNRKIRKLLEIGIINTVRLNIHYFGLRGLIRPVILASRKLKIQKMGGQIIAPNGRTGSIQIGLGYVGIVDNRFQRSVWQNEGEVIFNGSAYLGPGVRISNTGRLIFGNNVSISANSSIICKKEISFGNDALVSWECLFMDSDMHSIYNLNSDNKRNFDREVYIGNHVWIGCRSTILKGSIIADDSVVSACSVVSGKLLEAHCVYKNKEQVASNITWDY